MENIMISKELYKERLFSKGIFIILSFFTLLMAIYLFSQIIIGPLGPKPAPNWILIILVVFFVLCTINFSYINTSLTQEYIKVNYGIFSMRLNWSDIKECELDEKNSFYGWGVRFGKYKGRWVYIYNVIGGSRIAFISKHKKPRGLIISTKKPQEIIRIAKEYISDK